ncbi:MAG: hypothetical protein WCE48_08520, partial [Steroidobacteraceae bacterium]
MSSKALALLATLLAGCAMHVPFVAHDALREPAKRISDEAVHADYKTIAAVQERIRALNDAGRPVAGYDLAKAQCWL